MLSVKQWNNSFPNLAKAIRSSWENVKLLCHYKWPLSLLCHYHEKLGEIGYDQSLLWAHCASKLLTFHLTQYGKFKLTKIILDIGCIISSANKYNIWSKQEKPRKSKTPETRTQKRNQGAQCSTCNSLSILFFMSKARFERMVFLPAAYVLPSAPLRFLHCLSISQLSSHVVQSAITNYQIKVR